MKDLSTYNLDERIDWLSELEPDAIEAEIEDAYDDESRARLEKYRGEVTIAWFEYDSMPASAFFLAARPWEGRIRLRVHNDDEKYPDNEDDESVLDLPIRDIDQPFSACELIQFLDSVPSDVAGSATGWVQSDLTGDLRHSQDDRSDFGTIYEGVNAWYRDVIAHYESTGELIYLDEAGTGFETVNVNDVLRLDDAFRPEVHDLGDDNAITLARIEDGWYKRPERTIDVLMMWNGVRYHYAIRATGFDAATTEALESTILPMKQLQKPPTMRELVDALDGVEGWPGGLVFRNMTRRTAEPGQVRVTSDLYPELEERYLREMLRRLGSPRTKRQRNLIRFVRPGVYDFDQRSETYQDGAEIAHVDLYELPGLGYSLVADRTERGYGFSYLPLNVDRYPALPDLTPGIAEADEPLTFADLVRLIDTTTVPLANGDAATGLQQHWPLLDRDPDPQIRLKKRDLVEFSSEVYPDLGDLMDARAYDWSMKKGFATVEEMVELNGPYAPEQGRAVHRSLLGIFGDMEKE